MTMQPLLLPEDLFKKLEKRYHYQYKEWLAGRGEWPLVWKLGSPTEADIKKHSDYVRAWIAGWQAWHGAGELLWCEKQWRSLGKQRLPEKLIFTKPNEIAAWLGKTIQWEKNESRYHHLCSIWPLLTDHLSSYFDIFTYADIDFELLIKVLEWLEKNPKSNLYPRQLPIPGLDSKWLERRKEVISNIVAILQNETTNQLDFYQACGLKQPPIFIRMRILDKTLRAQIGGLEDIQASVHAIAALNLPIKRAFIIENLQTGLALEDLSGSIAIIGLGYHVNVLSSLSWLSQAKCYYWGDIDTHGFAILNRARSYIPHLESVLMDYETLCEHSLILVNEERQHASESLALLTAEEQMLYQGLKQQRWGSNTRLEQEKIAWDWAWPRLVKLVENGV